MNKAMTVTGILSLVLASSAARGQAWKNFNWIPSGRVAVGEERSEAESVYRSDAESAVRAHLAYRSGPPIASTGRKVSRESFRVRIATYRAGPIPTTLVLRRRWDTSEPATTLKVTVEGKELPSWTVPKFAGPRRWADIFYAIPLKAVQMPDGKRMRGRVSLSLSSDKPVGSYGYALFMTRDWDVLGAEHLGGVTAKDGGDAKGAYLSGLVALGEADHEAARKAFEKAAGEKGELALLARRMVRLIKLRTAMQALKVEKTPECFGAHYLLGLYASGNGFWEEALAEFGKAVTCNPADPDATYRLAEAMEYNRMPVATWAPIMERAGTLYNRTDTNVEDILVAINTRAVKGMCGQLSLGSMEALYRDWRYVEQMIYGASRGAWKLRTTYRVWGPGSAEWVMQAGWLFGPPDSEVPIRGTYDYSIGTAEFGSSHAGGVDCGVSGAAAAQIGPTRGWEVLLHEWNHEFDWVCIFGEQVPGYPVTHDSDGCGKQPLVSMGCGHYSSMRYYVTPAEYLRHEGSDPELRGNHIKQWAVAELTPLRASGKLEQWLVKSKWMKAEEIDALKKQWSAQRKKDKQKTPDWPEFLRGRWNAVRILNKVASPKEAAMVRGPAAARWKALTSKTDFVDLLKAFPKAPDKAVVYAQTFVWSPKKQETRLWLGFNPIMAAWLNGRKIHKGNYYAMAKWDNANRTDMVGNTAKLEKGWNRLLCKVERAGRGWGFSVGLTTFQNTPVAGLKYRNTAPSKLAGLYQRPKVGPHYKWSRVKDDYIEMLPALTTKDLQSLTGLGDLEREADRFFLKVGKAPAGARVLPEADPKDRELNNFLNWDEEAVAAVRYVKGGKTRDLLLIRPEYFEEYLEILQEDAKGLPGTGPKDRLLGTLFIEKPKYASTGNRAGRRYVLVVETSLGTYPLDEQDLLGVQTKAGSK